MRGSILKLAAVVAVVMACVTAFAQQPTLASALDWLNKVKGGFSPAVQKDVPALESILKRYFSDPDSLRASEEEIAIAFIDTIPKKDDSDFEGRGGTLDKLSKFDAMLGGKGNAAAPPPKKVSAPKAPKPKPVVLKPKTKPKVVVKHKVPGIHAKATFTAESRNAPGGKTIGVVQLNIGGRSKTVVEVLAGTSKLDAKKRAQVVASRMQSLNNSSRLWWTMLKVAQVKGQYVVGTGGKNFVITADSAFASEWGLTPSALASQLILKIRSSMDPEKSEQFGGRDLSPEEMRVAAIDLRQQGDALYSSKPDQAEAKYKSAIANDPTYGVPYLRLADLYLGKNNTESAKSILNDGLKVGGMSPDQKGALESKLKSLS